MKQKNVQNKTLEQAENPGNRIYLDISTIKYPSAGGARFWALFVHDHSDFVFGKFMKHKADLSIQGIKAINTVFNNYRVKIERIQCDIAGENKAFEQEIIKKKMNIIFEYTAMNTPQQNGRVERKFATMYGTV